eukprot:292605_1
MLSWVFQGNFGDIIAPFAGPEQQLIVAIQNNQRDKIQDLLQNKGVSPGCHNLHGTTPIHIAVKAGYHDIAEMLLRMGADLTAVDNAGNSALHYAARGGYFPTIEWLIEQGLSASEGNSAGQTPYDVSENHAIRQYLLPLQLKTLARQASLKEVTGIHGQSYPTTPAMMPQPPPLPIASISQPPSHYVPTQNPHEQPPLGSFEEQQQSDVDPQNCPESYSFDSFVPCQVMAGGGEAIQLQSSEKRVNDCNNSLTNTIPPPSQPAVSSVNQTVNPYRKTSINPIRPDGFHSSASDKKLQKRYNHTQVQYDLAPPPTANQLNVSQSAEWEGYHGFSSNSTNSASLGRPDSFFHTDAVTTLPIPHQRGPDESQPLNTHPY